MRLIRGAAGSGKTALVFREFKEALRQSRSSVRIVVPTATLVRHFQHELARDGFVFPPAAIISLNRFLRERAPDLKLVPDAVLRVIAGNTLARLRLPEFSEVAETQGMVSVILDTIALFENAGATPQRLAAVRKLTPHAKAFQKIWIAVHEAVLRCGYATKAELLRSPQPASSGRIWMDGFITFSPIEKELIGNLARSCDLTITVTDAPEGDEIRRLALQLGAEERLLRGGRGKPPIVAVQAISVEREADEIARRVLELRQSGVPFRQMAVALRDAGPYLPLLRGAFERFGIPARFYFSAPLQRQPAAQFLGGLVNCVLNGWEFGTTLDTLRAHPVWGTGAAFDRFDFKVREAMPGRGVEALLALCEEDFAKRIAPCFAVDVWRDDLQPPALWQSRFVQLAEALYRPSQDMGGIETARSHVAALYGCLEAIGHAAELLAVGGEAVSLDRFWRVVSQAIEGGSVKIPDDRRDVVHVMNAFEARQWDVTVLFVCGMTDRQFPKKNPQNLLFADGDIDSLQKAGIPLRRAADLDREEIALFESLKTRAESSLVLTWPTHDAAGKSVESSRLIADLGLTPLQAQACRATPGVPSPVPGIAGRLHASSLLSSLVVQHRKISLSALEDLAQCRFKFFAGRTLGLKGRPERPLERINHRVNGIILHEALEAWLNVGRAGDFVELFESAFDKACRDRHLPPGYRLEVERIFLRGIARGVSASERWAAVSSEPEVELALDFPGGVTVSCRVDRIDKLNERDCVIVDYKSGKTAGVGQLVKSAVKLQGPFYALAAKEKLGLNTVAMMYVAVRDDKPFGWGEIPGVDLGLEPIPPRWMEDARDRAIDRLSSLLNGAVHADPVEVELCQWCDFAHACRYGSEAAKTEAAHGD